MVAERIMRENEPWWRVIEQELRAVKTELKRIHANTKEHEHTMLVKLLKQEAFDAATGMFRETVTKRYQAPQHAPPRHQEQQQQQPRAPRQPYPKPAAKRSYAPPRRRGAGGGGEGHDHDN
jgi:hypothetical protein